eukprot:c11199_g1_i2.p1 GENE.c11199_g1_i2~~c11199_g1_i2.p1  ORF type:complete len:281 (-),score=56.02 c11199_g1_i2:140-982(-)
MLVRDWSAEGAAERATSYAPVLRALTSHKPPSFEHRYSVLIPGAGLGRLAWECARLGYAAQGNEFSYFCLLSSSLVLNHSLPVDCFTLHPFVHQSLNVRETQDQMRPITVPDTSPSGLPPDSDFSMAAGDFLEVYQTPGQWDAIATCFFLDTAKNILAYIERIHQILADDGVWVNLGPLLYHFADSPNERSIELSWEEVKTAIILVGFELVEEQWISCRYTANERGMMQVVYDCIFFVAKKSTRVQANVDQDAAAVGDRVVEGGHGHSHADGTFHTHDCS